jgi:hypothetical protein
METITSFLAVLIGVLLRLAIPIIGTAMLIYFLRKLDSRWQTEAQLQPVPVQNSECWKIKGCSAQEQKNCLAKTSSLPCWQIYRLPNGYLREECLSCKVFIDAPIPALRTEPRRM